MTDDKPPIIDYEGSDYQTSFWEESNRQYEDRAEAVALQRLLPASGRLMLELGAGAGRNTPRYRGYERIVLLDYSFTQLVQAQERLGRSGRYLYVAGDVYHLPFQNAVFDAATMIRVIHHLADPARALDEIQRVLESRGTFILEFANKQNLKAILRYWMGRQDWSPFTLKPVEFVELNYDFHPRYIREQLQQAGFEIERQLTVSHFRLNLLKENLPTPLLVSLDSLAQLTGNLWQLSPSVFVRGRAAEKPHPEQEGGLFHCPDCRESALVENGETISCPACGSGWPIRDGIYDFREQD